MTSIFYVRKYFVCITHYYNISMSSLASLPAFVVWGIWLPRNTVIFYGNYILAQIIVSRSFGIFKAFPREAPIKPVCIINPPIIDASFPWAFVD